MHSSATLNDPPITPPSQGRLNRWGTPDLLPLITVLFWGTNVVALKWTLNSVSPYVANVLRFVFACAILLPLAWHEARHIRIARADWSRIVAASVTGMGIAQVGYLVGLNLTTATNTSLLSATMPILVGLVGSLIGTDRLGRRGWLGIFLSFVGILVVIGGPGGGTLAGNLIVLGGTLCWAVSFLILRPLVRRYSSTLMTTFSIGGGIVMLTLIGLPSLATTDWATVRLTTWLLLAYSGVFSVAIGNLLWNKGIGLIGAARTTIYANLIPVIAAFTGWLALGERLTPPLIVGAVVILAGIYLVQSERVGG